MQDTDDTEKPDDKRWVFELRAMWRRAMRAQAQSRKSCTEERRRDLTHHMPGANRTTVAITASILAQRNLFP